MFLVRFGTLVVRHASKLPSQAWSQMAPMSEGYYVTSEDKVPSRLKLLHEEVLFLLTKKKICSSAALEWGILSTTVT